MMIAVDENGKEYIAIESQKQDLLICPACCEPVILKTGKQKIAHFAHQSRKNCLGFSEGETSEHLQLKTTLFEWCRTWLKDVTVQLEENLPSLNQRPDILCGNLAIEIQCSMLSYKSVQERTKGYLMNGYRVWWILGSSFFRKDSLRSSDKYFCMYNEERGVHVWKLDLDQKKCYLFHHIKESVMGVLTFEQMSWAFFSHMLVDLLEVNLEKMK
ncbi:MAG: competence protein ComA [Enterococcus lacertideformus]|uniref:Competence protein ComA n=1 Tax=Enterococcus lacertideformus TaxID=2771493 RepID=A0A931AWF8_9ENTE|nr:competence protein ComA [Enterococcus lacertideformus]